MELWILAAVIAASLQTVRFMLQKILSSGQLSTAGATFARFCYSAPLFWIAVGVYFWVNGLSPPKLSQTFWGYAAIGGLSQILATVCVVALFRTRNFAVGITFKKTEVIQAVCVGILVLGEGISLIGLFAILIGLIGVLLLSDQPFGGAKGISRFANRATGLGILSGFLFAISAVSYRGATLEVDFESPLLRASVTLLLVITLQMVVMTVWLYLREPGQLQAVWAARKTALWVGLTSLGGSLGWFTAFTLQNAAYVKAVGQVELILSLAASVLFFREKITRRELGGLAFLIISILILVLRT